MTLPNELDEEAEMLQELIEEADDDEDILISDE